MRVVLTRPKSTDIMLAHVVKRIEGTSDTWQLLRRDLYGEPYYYRLLTNAFSMSATNPRNQRYMRLFAYLPLAFRPESEDVLLTLLMAAALRPTRFFMGRTSNEWMSWTSRRKCSPSLIFIPASITPIPCVIRACTPVVQDGRFFLQASPRQYDIISGEPPPPKVAGSVNLYTQEFFSLMNSRLKEGGIATFWLPINQLKVDEAKAILRAFHNAILERVGVGRRRSRLDNDGHQRSGPQSAGRGNSAAMEPLRFGRRFEANRY